MTDYQAIKVMDTESVQRFPTTVTCSDYLEAKARVLELAKRGIENGRYDNDMRTE